MYTDEQKAEFKAQGLKYNLRTKKYEMQNADGSFPGDPPKQEVAEKSVEPVTKLPSEDQLVSVKASELTALIQRIDSLEAKVKERPAPATGDFKGLAGAIADATAAKTAADQNTEMVFTEENIPLDDYLKTPVTIYTFCSYKPIFDDRRGGHAIKTPYGRPIVLKFSGNMPNGKGTNVPVATGKLETKKELDFIRKHSLFGIEIFETAAGALSTDPNEAQLMSNVMTMVNTMTQAEVISRVKNEGGVEISPDIERMRHDLFTKLFNEEKLRQEQWNQLHRKQALERQNTLNSIQA